MLLHVEMIYLAKQAKRGVEKKAFFVYENRNKIEPRTGFLQFYVKTKKVCKCLPVLAHNKRILHMAFTLQFLSVLRTLKIEPIMFYKELCQSFQAQ